MPISAVLLAAIAVSNFQVATLAAQEQQLRGREQLRGAVPTERPVEAGSAELTPGQVYQRTGPAVVLLICTNASGTGELGTGSIIDSAGHIVTNAHVVVDPTTGQPYPRIHVYFKPQHVTGDPARDATNPSVATVLKWDKPMDLAVLQLSNAPSGLAILPIGNSDVLEAGEPVVAIGHPEQGGFWTLTTGVVSTVIANLGGVQGKDAFQTDASINRGNSGGPLISRQGAMVGINTSIARKATDGLAITAVNFSIKSNVVTKWLDDNGTGVAYVKGGEQVAAAAEAQPVPPPEEAPQVALADQPSDPEIQALAPAGEASAGPETTSPIKYAKGPKRKYGKKGKAKGAWAKSGIVTRAKPYSISSAIARDMAEMEDLELELQQEINKKREQLNRGKP